MAAIDAETLRRSFGRAAGASPLQVVAAFGCAARASPSQPVPPPGCDEITAARALLGPLDLTGTLATGDALHRQAETAGWPKPAAATGCSRWGATGP